MQLRSPSGGQIALLPLQEIVEVLCHCEERFVGVHDVPVCRDAQRAEGRDQRAEHDGDSPAGRCRTQQQETDAVHRRAQLSQLLDNVFTDERDVPAYGDRWK
ncbi:MAG: hypothetical protein GEU73_01680 [Chloroflexi bacterium]|nr:hypothetical protein [Chloroflexota bacterium]